MNFLANYVSYLESIGIFPANASVGNYVVVAILAILFTLVVVVVGLIALLGILVILFRITKWLANKIAGGSFTNQSRKFMRQNSRLLRQKKLRQSRGW
jgi:uncharacterized membrane protein